MIALLIAAAAVQIVPAGQSFTCTPVAVYDGDGPIWCEEGPRIRLAGIAAREMDGTCNSNQPCPTASAEAARDALVGLVGVPTGRTPQGHVKVSGRPLRCVSNGSGVGTRTAASCRTRSGADLSCAMLRTGTVLRWARYDPTGRLAACSPS